MISNSAPRYIPLRIDQDQPLLPPDIHYSFNLPFSDRQIHATQCDILYYCLGMPIINSSEHCGYPYHLHILPTNIPAQVIFNKQEFYRIYITSSISGPPEKRLKQ